MSTNDDVMQFLDSLGQGDDLSTSHGHSHNHSREHTTSSSGSSSYFHVTATGDETNTPDEQSVLDFLDEITQSAAVSTPISTQPSPSVSALPGTSSHGASGLLGHGSTRGASTSAPSKYLQQKQQQLLQQQQQQELQQQQGASWLGSLWSTASEAVKTTQTAVQSSVKATRESQASKNLQERVKGIVNAENIGKIGSDLKSLTSTVLDAIALPITEHEVIEIWLAHDMVGYVGLEALVNRSFAKVMEQTAASEVVVHKGDGTHSEDVGPEDRQLNACDGYEQAVKLAKANIEHLVKTHYNPEKQQREPPESYSQSMPAHWLLIPYEENEWVEERMAGCIRLAVAALTEDYVWIRTMAGRSLSIATLREKSVHVHQMEATEQ
ncbi:hypothetical protein BG006_003936 [Podila minutissima]|uniref:Uncharacterized protein n=1 Tax=Podila minutissima TaxID=64525 RepID=A0A9P5SPD2_9FUNG|nr:hypothetical protein BG006_003936 [Podila minutissima]